MEATMILISNEREREEKDYLNGSFISSSHLVRIKGGKSK